MGNNKVIKMTKEKNKWTSSSALAAYFLVGLFAVTGVAAYFILSSHNSAPAIENAAGSGGPAQEIRMAVSPTEYQPSTLTVKAGQPVRWIVDGTNAQGCTRYLLAQKVGISKSLTKGENIIEFTPTEKGTVPFQCSMGMVRGTINVV